MTFNRINEKAFMKKNTRLAFFAVLSVVVLWNVVGYGVRLFLDPPILNAKADYQLYIHLSSTVQDFPSANPFAFSLRYQPNVWDVDQGLRAAADDPKISTVLIHLDDVRLTVLHATTLGESIKYFRSKGKKVVCYSASFDSMNGGEAGYVLASYCDVIQLQRLGSVVLEMLNYEDILGEENTPEEVHSSVALTKINADINHILRANRQVRSQEQIINDKHYMDTQALKAGLVDEIVPQLIQSEYTVVIQDYVRLLEQFSKNKANVVAVIPITKDDKDDVVKAICARSDIQAVVIHAQLGVEMNNISNKIGNTPVVLCASNLDSVDGHSLNESIDTVIKLAALDQRTIRVEIIHPGSWLSYVTKDLFVFGKSMVSMFKRSINYIAKMANNPK